MSYDIIFRMVEARSCTRKIPGIAHTQAVNNFANDNYIRVPTPLKTLETMYTLVTNTFLRKTETRSCNRKISARQQLRLLGM